MLRSTVLGNLKLSTSACILLTISVISRWNWLKLAGFMQNCLLNPINVTACRFVEFEARYDPNSRTSARVCKKMGIGQKFQLNCLPFKKRLKRVFNEDYAWYRKLLKAI